jgi:transketolase
VVLGSHGGITLGKDDPTQMGIKDLTLMGRLPTMVMLVPSDPTSMHAAVRATSDYISPVFLRFSRVVIPNIYPANDCPFEIGKANIVHQGKDLTIIDIGIMVAAGLDAAALLEKEGIQARVIDLFTIRPLDRDTIVNATRETGAIVSAEEHLLHLGLGTNIARIVAENYAVRMRFIGLADVYVESADPSNLLEIYHLTAQDIVLTPGDVYKAKISGAS